jgi:hypothetical protein
MPGTLPRTGLLSLPPNTGQQASRSTFGSSQGINPALPMSTSTQVGPQTSPTTTRHNIGAAELWTCYAICDGITTATVTIYDPDANVTATPNNNNAGISLIVS